MAHCTFIKPNGEPCAANAQIGKSLCVFHDPYRASEVQRARRAGGLSRSRPAFAGTTDARNYPLKTSRDVSELLAEIMNRVLKGELDPRTANCVGNLANVQLRALQDGPIDERVSKIEAELIAHRRDKK
jgi:hypothetical protein